MSCTTCNSCCFPERPPEVVDPGYRQRGSYVPLTAADVDKIQAAGHADWIVQEPNARYSRASGYLKTVEYSDKHEKCIAQTGEPGKKGGCSIYDARPEACRVYKPGSIDCQYIRGSNGLKRLYVAQEVAEAYCEYVTSAGSAAHLYFKDVLDKLEEGLKDLSE